jgi:hypothetical protein
MLNPLHRSALYYKDVDMNIKGYGGNRYGGLIKMSNKVGYGSTLNQYEGIFFGNDGSMMQVGYNGGGAIVSFGKTGSTLPNTSITEMSYIRTSDGGLTTLSDKRKKKNFEDVDAGVYSCYKKIQFKKFNMID